MEEVEHIDEAPYQVMGSPDGKKEKKIGKPVKSRKYADARAAELSDTHKKTGGKFRSQYVEALDPVGKEDGDVNNDGKKDSSDSYLLKRRKAIAKALGKKKQNEEVEQIGEDIRSEKGKAKMKAMIAARTTDSGRAKPGKGQNVKDIKHIGRANVDGYGGTPSNQKMAKNPLKRNFTGLRSYTGKGGNKAARRAGQPVKDTRREEVENPSKDLKSAVKKAVKRIDHNVSGDVDKNDKSMGNYGEFVPSVDGKKKLTTKIGESYYSWRTNLAEVMDDIESKPIKEKAVKNKVTINPKLSEAVEEIGGQVLEVTEIQEDASMSPQEIQLQKKKAMIDKMIATKRQQGLSKAKKSEEPAKAVGEEMSIKDQMRISQEYNRKSPEEKKAIHKKAVAGIPKGKPKKDTRTDAQKMTDATGPRPGSRYRGD